MAIPVLGTAHLFGLVTPPESERLMRAALDAGYRAIDTAPSYGFGRSEEAVGRMLADHPDTDLEITTKVGIAALPPPGRALRLAKSVARRAPQTVQQRLRGDSDTRRPEQGRFGAREVRESIDSSLRRLRRIDRLLLHEVRPDDLSDALLGQLAQRLADGDVGQLGVATANQHTAACLERAPELFTAANVSIAPTAHPVARHARLSRITGHGVFGADGADLHRVQHRLRTDPRAAAAWRAATADTPWSGAAGVADALVLRALAVTRPDGVIVATRRTDRMARMHRVITGDVRLPASVTHVLDALCDGAEVTRPV